MYYQCHSAVFETAITPQSPHTTPPRLCFSSECNSSDIYLVFTNSARLASSTRYHVRYIPIVVNRFQTVVYSIPVRDRASTSPHPANPNSFVIPPLAAERLDRSSGGRPPASYLRVASFSTTQWFRTSKRQQSHRSSLAGIKREKH